MLEQSIQASILKWLAKQPNCWVVKTITSNKKGTPDILACIKGAFVAIEVKRPGGRVTRLQHYQLDRIQECGGHATVAYSLDEVKKFLEEKRLLHEKN